MPKAHLNRHGWGCVGGSRNDAKRFGVLYEDALPMGPSVYAQSKRQFIYLIDPPSCSGSSATKVTSCSIKNKYPKRHLVGADKDDEAGAESAPTSPKSNDPNRSGNIDFAWRRVRTPGQKDRLPHKENEEVMNDFMRWVLPRWKSLWVRFKRDGTMEWPEFEAFVRYETNFEGVYTQKVFQLLDLEGSGKIRNRVLMEARRNYENQFILRYKGLKDLQRLLIGKYGCVTRAWRTIFDHENNYCCPMLKFTRVCQQVGYNGNIKGLWSELTGGDIGCPLRHQHIAPENDYLLNRMAVALQDTYPSMREGWLAMMRSGACHNRVTPTEFHAFLSPHGFTSKETTRLYNCLNCFRNNSITDRDLHFFAQFEDGVVWTKYAASPGCCSSHPSLARNRATANDDGGADLDVDNLVSETVTSLKDMSSGQSWSQDGVQRDEFDLVMSREDLTMYLSARYPNTFHSEKADLLGYKDRNYPLAPFAREKIREALKNKTWHGPVGERFADLFKIIQNDRNGEIDMDEMFNVFRNVFHLGKRDVSDDEIVSFFRFCDADGGGTVDLDEFCAFITDAQLVPSRGYRQMYRPQLEDLHQISDAINAATEAARIKDAENKGEEENSGGEGSKEEKRFQDAVFEVVRDAEGKVKVVSGKRTNQTKERSALEQIFATVDLDGSGALDFDELKAFFDTTDQLNDKPRMDSRKTMEQLQIIDVSGDGLIDSEEFTEFFLTQLPERKEEREETLNELMRAALHAKKLADAKDKEKQKREHAKEAKSAAARSAAAGAGAADGHESDRSGVTHTASSSKPLVKKEASKDTSGAAAKKPSKKEAIIRKNAQAKKKPTETVQESPPRSPRDDKEKKSPPPSPRQYRPDFGRPDPAQAALLAEQRVVQKAEIVAALGKDKLDLTLSSNGQISDMLRKTAMTAW